MKDDILESVSHRSGKNSKRQKIMQKRFGNLDYFHYLCMVDTKTLIMAKQNRVNNL
jgi:hypothetical protein